MTCRHRWIVHGGESSDASHILYSVQRSSSLRMKTRLDVFLPSNADENVPNFQVIGSYHSQSFKVYKGETLPAEVLISFFFVLDYVSVIFFLFLFLFLAIGCTKFYAFYAIGR